MKPKRGICLQIEELESRLVLAAPPSTPVPLGVNLNGALLQNSLSDLPSTYLQDIGFTGTSYVRGFIDYAQFAYLDYQRLQKGQDQSSLSQYFTALRTISTSHPTLYQTSSFYQTIINIKFEFNLELEPQKDSGFVNFVNSTLLQLPTGQKYEFPTTTAEYSQYLTYLPDLLSQLSACCSIMVIGNEPLIETPKTTVNNTPDYYLTPNANGTSESYMSLFYEYTANSVQSYYTANPSPAPGAFYLGAYDNLWTNPAPPTGDWRTWATPLLKWTSTNSWLAGADVHIHQSQAGVAWPARTPQTNQIDQVFAFVKSNLASNQKILVTEFSQVNYYGSQLASVIPAIPALQAYGIPSPSQTSNPWKVYQFLDYAMGHPYTKYGIPPTPQNTRNQPGPVPISVWNAFLTPRSNSWYTSQVDSYLTNAWKDFTSYGNTFAIATYGLYQFPGLYAPAGTKGDSDQPWVLNAIYANATVNSQGTQKPKGMNYWFNSTVGTQFVAIVRNSPSWRLYRR